MNKQLRERLRIPPNPLRLSEAQMQRAVFAELRLREQQYPQLRYVIHVPNEGKRSNIGGALAKMGGLQTGVLDMTSLTGTRWAMELKVGDNVPTAEQSWWMNELINANQIVGLAYNTDEAIDFVLYQYNHSGWPMAAWRALEWLNILAENKADITDPRELSNLKTRAW